LDVNERCPGQLEVTGIKDEGHVPKWNQDNPTLKVGVGHFITKINGEPATRALAIGMEKGKQAVLEVHSSAPTPVAVAPQSVVMVMGNAASPPAGVPSDSQLVKGDKYVGNNTMALACLGCLCCGCLACAVLLCPIDERDVWVSPKGEKYDTLGKKIE